MSRGLLEEKIITENGTKIKLEKNLQKFYYLKNIIFFLCLRSVSQINFELVTDKNASGCNEGRKVSEKRERMEKRSANDGGGGFYLSDLHFCCTDAALFRRIIITPLGTREGEREGEGGSRAAGRNRKQQRGSSISLVFYDYTSYTTRQWRRNAGNCENSLGRQ